LANRNSNDSQHSKDIYDMSFWAKRRIFDQFWAARTNGNRPEMFRFAQHDSTNINEI